MATLSSVIDINPESVTKSYPHSEIEYIDISSVGTGKHSGTKTLTLKRAPSRAKRIVKDGDTILATVRPNLRSFLYLKNPVRNTVASTGFAVLRTKPGKMDGRYLYYTVTTQYFTDYLTLNAKGSAYPAVDAGIIGRAEINLPGLPEQQRIAGMLGAYDDLIENNSKRIEKLESMARLLYHHYFENEKVRKRSQVPFLEYVELNPKTTVPKDGEKPYVPMESLQANSMLLSFFGKRTGNSGSKFKSGDTLFARITPSLENGKTGFVYDLPDGYASAFGSTEFIVMRSKTLSPEIVYLVARSDMVRKTAIKSMTGASGRQRVQEKCFAELTLPRLDRDEVTALTEKLRPVYRQINTLHRRNVMLDKARDLLLPRLMSGEIEA